MVMDLSLCLRLLGGIGRGRGIALEILLFSFIDLHAILLNG